MRDSVVHQTLQMIGEGGNGAVKAQGGTRGQLDFAKRRVFIEHVDDAELIEVEAHVGVELRLQDLRDADRYLRAG